MAWNVKSLAILIGIPMIILSATALYYLSRKDEDDYEDGLHIKTSRARILEMKIPKANVGVVIGRAGSNIKEVELKSDTKIKFYDDVDDEEFRTCVIRGSNEAVQLAEALIHEFITNQPLIEMFEMWVPQMAMGRIIGRCGDTIKGISRASNAKVSADSISSSANTDGQRRIMIKGTAEQIAVAKSLIEEKVEEDADARMKFDKTTANRYPRNKNTKAISATATNQTHEDDSMKHKTEKLISVSSDGSMQIYVSAVVSPSQFWAQVISPKSVELDHLVDQMTEYYTRDENKELHTIKELSIGQMVAAPFDFDEKWYRAEVCDIVLDEYDLKSSKVKLYYVDYGDKSDRKQGELYQLRTDFLKLHFQAIECCLARVKPSTGDKWTEEGIDLFEDLSQAAQWRALTARTVSYKKGEQLHREREGSPVPCVDLFNDEKEVDIGSELIANGLAVPIENPESLLNGSSSSPSSSPKKRYITERNYNKDTDKIAVWDKPKPTESLSQKPDNKLVEQVSLKRHTAERLSDEEVISTSEPESGPKDLSAPREGDSFPRDSLGENGYAPKKSKVASDVFISGEVSMPSDGSRGFDGEIPNVGQDLEKGKGERNLSTKFLSEESASGRDHITSLNGSKGEGSSPNIQKVVSKPVLNSTTGKSELKKQGGDGASSQRQVHNGIGQRTAADRL